MKTRTLLALLAVVLMLFSFSPAARADSYLNITVGASTISCDNSSAAGVSACAANGFSTALNGSSISSLGPISIGGYTIAGVNISGNQPGTPTSAFALASEFNVTNQSGSQTLIIEYASNQFSNPVGTPVSFTASQAATFTTAQPGDTQKFTGYGNGANTLAAT